MEADRPHEQDLIRVMYDAFNTRDLQRLAAFMAQGVDWPDGDARMHGLGAVKDYWSRSWARVHTHDQVVDITFDDAGRTAVRIRQVIRDLGGTVVSTGAFEHTYTFGDGLVLRMDLRELQLEAKE